ncbi:MAG TPA: dynamin family protein [Acidimicrobiales bacterium]|nr:dynamin family protein [Acidimicrobiales bacterium]
MAGNPNAGDRSATVQQALSVVDLGRQATKAYARPDLSARLGATHKRLSDPAFHVFVIGEFKQGKSSLVNALLNAPVCPVDDDIATAVPTAIRYGDPPAAAVLFDPGGDPSDPDREPIREEIPIDQVAHHVTEASDPSGERRVSSVDVSLPRKLLTDGLVIVDTPASAAWARPTARRPSGPCPWRTRWCSCPTPARSSRAPSWSSSRPPGACAPTWCAC